MSKGIACCFLDPFWNKHWKSSIQQCSRGALDSVLVPGFGRKMLPRMGRHDVLAFRDSRAGCSGSVHAALMMLWAVLGYAEKLGYRAPGSNPCGGAPRYKPPLKKRYRFPREYQRLSAVFRGSPGQHAALGRDRMAADVHGSAQAWD